MTADRETVLRLGLAWHEISQPRGYAFIVCSCSAEFETRGDALAHVARALAKALGDAEVGGDALVGIACGRGYGIGAAIEQDGMDDVGTPHQRWRYLHAGCRALLDSGATDGGGA